MTAHACRHTVNVAAMNYVAFVRTVCMLIALYLLVLLLLAGPCPLWNRSSLARSVFLTGDGKMLKTHSLPIYFLSTRAGSIRKFIWVDDVLATFVFRVYFNTAVRLTYTRQHSSMW